MGHFVCWRLHQTLTSKDLCASFGQLSLGSAIDLMTQFTKLRKRCASVRIPTHEAYSIAAHGNLAQLNLLKGDLTAAEKHLRACFETVAEGSQAWRCFLDTAAQLDLVRGDLKGAEAKLSQISDRLSPHAAEPTWPNIEVNLTRIQLLQRAGKLEEAVVLAERAARLARSRADGFLEPRFRFKQVELLVDLGRKDEALGVLSFANLPVRRVGLPLLAETDRVRSRVLAAFGLRTESVAALSRARRVEIATGRNIDLESLDSTDEDAETGTASTSVLRELEAAARWFDFSSRPDLLAAEVTSLLEASGAARRCWTVKKPVDVEQSVLGRSNSDRQPGKRSVVVDLGTYRGVRFELNVQPSKGVYAESLVAAVVQLVGAAVTLESFNREHKVPSVTLAG